MIRGKKNETQTDHKRVPAVQKKKWEHETTEENACDGMRQRDREREGEMWGIKTRTEKTRKSTTKKRTEEMAWRRAREKREKRDVDFDGAIES